MIASGRHNTCGTSLKKPVGVTTILGNQGQDPVNSDPDKASGAEAYEGLGPTPDLSRQTLELVCDDNVPVGRKHSGARAKASSSFKFKKKARISSKETEEIQRTHRSLFSWMKNPQSSPNSAKTDSQGEKNDLIGEVSKGRGEKMDVDRPEYEVWALEWLTGTIEDIETNRKVCRSLVEEVVHGSVVQGERRHITMLVQRVVSDAWKDAQINKLWETFLNLDRDIQAGVEKRLATWGEEERILLRMGEEQERRELKVEKARNRSRMFKQKAAAMLLRKVLTKMRELSVEDWDMEVVEEVEEMLSEAMEHNGIEAEEQNMEVDSQTNQQEGDRTSKENISSPEADLDKYSEHPAHSPDPERIQLTGEAWSWRQPNFGCSQTSQQEGSQPALRNTTSLWEDLDENNHPAYTPDPDNIQPAGESWSWRQPGDILGLLEPGDDDEKGAGAPRRRRSMKIDDIIGDLEKSSGCGPTLKTTKIPTIDCIPMVKVSKEIERFNIFNEMDNIPNSNCNYNSFSFSNKQQPAKISVVCDWSRKVTNSDRVSGATKRKGEEMMNTKTKKLRLSHIVDP